MNGYKRGYRGLSVLVVLLLTVAAAIIAYNVGLSHGLAQSAIAQGSRESGNRVLGGNGRGASVADDERECR